MGTFNRIEKLVMILSAVMVVLSGVLVFGNGHKKQWEESGNLNPNTHQISTFEALALFKKK